MSVNTSDDLRAQFENWPDDYKIRVDEDVVILFAYPAPAVDWVGPVFVEHIPSFSSVTIDFDGCVMDERYGSPEGEAKIKAVLTDEVWPATIREGRDEAGEIGMGDWCGMFSTAVPAQ